MSSLMRAVSGIILASGISLAFMALPVLAIGEGGAPAGVEAARGAGVPSNLASGDTSIVRNVINIMLYAIGVISVIMLIYGGFRYIISGGQKDAVTNAKNTILYAIIGLLIAIFSYAIIRFVIDAATGMGGGTTDV